MKINKTQWRVISNGIDRVINLINIAGEQIRAVAILLRVIGNLEFEQERGKAECKTCLFGYSGDSDNGHIVVGGDCRERPPVRVPVPKMAGIREAGVDSGWPKVNADDWCGHYRRRKP